MRFRHLIVSSLMGLVLGFVPVNADEPEKKDPIDVEVDQMMAKDPSTVGMNEAIGHGIEQWDAAMNKAYNSLMQKLPEDERPVLKKSQLAWLAYRDANTGLIDKVYGHCQGTMYIPMASDELLELVKTRTLLLRNYLDLLDQNSPDSK